jgi:hypothetical protein
MDHVETQKYVGHEQKQRLHLEAGFAYVLLINSTMVVNFYHMIAPYFLPFNWTSTLAITSFAPKKKMFWHISKYFLCS